MHIVMTSLLVALVVCAVLLCAFALFTRTRVARRIDAAEHRRAAHRIS
jgi:septation ring formation regulator EzrA